MKKLLFLVCLTAIFISCKNDQPDHDDAVIPVKTAMAVQNNALPASIQATTNTNTLPETSVTPQQIQMQNPGPVLGTPNKVAAGASGKMNPAHGQPGHRCDIPVGAPLSTPLQKPVAQNAPQQNVVAQTQQSQPQLATGKGLNPAHGQPGHRCDIPVGAPLSTPLQKPVAQNVPQQVVTSKPLQPQIATGKGLNPAHGQPGHRCDIAVGALLSSPVQKTPAQGVAVPQPMASPVGAPIALPVTGTATGSTAKLNPPHGQPGHDCKIAVGQPLK